MKDLRAPWDELISELLGLLADEGVYYEARVLATQALADLLTRKNVECGEDRCAVLRRVSKTMRTLLDLLGPAVLHNATLECLTAIENAQ